MSLPFLTSASILKVIVVKEFSNNSIMPPPLNNEQKQKLANLASKYDMKIRPPH